MDCVIAIVVNTFEKLVSLIFGGWSIKSLFFKEYFRRRGHQIGESSASFVFKTEDFKAVFLE